MCACVGDTIYTIKSMAQSGQKEAKLFNRPKTEAEHSTTEIVEKVVSAWSKKHRNQQSPRGPFSLDGKPLSDHDAAAQDLLLPVFIWQADATYRFAMSSAGMGAQFKDDSAALLGSRVSLDKVHRSTTEILCFVVEALEDARKNMARCNLVDGAVDLRALVNGFSEEMSLPRTLTQSGSNTPATP
ncbi:hypothetical protein CBP35_20030 (plasmid) [Acidovorax carolinensis]|nr:hypothetical protein CBP35_20030 [Acidovorax carolinensis]